MFTTGRPYLSSIEANCCKTVSFISHAALSEARYAWSTL